jgi:hypothetical protein
VQRAYRTTDKEAVRIKPFGIKSEFLAALIDRGLPHYHVRPRNLYAFFMESLWLFAFTEVRATGGESSPMTKR